MNMTIASRYEEAPFELDKYIEGYQVHVKSDSESLAKTNDTLNRLIITLQVPKSDYGNEQIQTILNWASSKYTDAGYYRDFEVVTEFGENEQSIVFSDAESTYKEKGSTEEDMVWIELTVDQKRDRLPGAVFGEDLEETYQLALEKGANPPTLNIVVPAVYPSVAGDSINQSNAEYSAPSYVKFNALTVPAGSTKAGIRAICSDGSSTILHDAFIYNKTGYTLGYANLDNIVWKLGGSVTPVADGIEITLNKRKKTFKYLKVDGKTYDGAIKIAEFRDELSLEYNWDSAQNIANFFDFYYRQYRYISYDSLHVIKTTAYNLNFIDVDQSGKIGTNRIGVNGGFFEQGDNLFYNIAIMDGDTPIKAHQSYCKGLTNNTNTQKNKRKTGTLIFEGSKFKVEDRFSADGNTASVSGVGYESSIMNKCKWAQGGLQMYLSAADDEYTITKLLQEQWEKYVDGTVPRTAIVGFNHIYVYLIVAAAKNLYNFRSDIKSFLTSQGLDHNSCYGLYLDGGKSTGMSCRKTAGGNVEAIITPDRALREIIVLNGTLWNDSL